MFKKIIELFYKKKIEKIDYKYQCEWCDTMFSHEPFDSNEHIFCSGVCETEYVNWQDEPLILDDKYIKSSDYDWMV